MLVSSMVLLVGLGLPPQQIVMWHQKNLLHMMVMDMSSLAILARSMLPSLMRTMTLTR